MPRGLRTGLTVKIKAMCIAIGLFDSLSGTTCFSPFLHFHHVGGEPSRKWRSGIPELLSVDAHWFCLLSSMHVHRQHAALDLGFGDSSCAVEIDGGQRSYSSIDTQEA